MTTPKQSLPKKIDFKQVGKTVVAVINKKKKSIELPKLTEAKSLKENLEAFNKRPSESRFAKILAAFETKKEKVAMVKKGEKKLAKKKVKETKKEIKTLKEPARKLVESIDKAQEEKTVEAAKTVADNTPVQAPVASTHRRSGEH